MKFNLTFKLTSLLVVFLAVVFSLQLIFLADKGLEVGRRNITLGADAFASLSAGEILKNYNNYYDTDFNKYLENTNAMLAKSANLVKIKILNKKGEILFDSKEDAGGKYQGQTRLADNDELQTMAGMAQLSRFTKEDGVEYFEVINPYAWEEDNSAYVVEYYFSFFVLERDIRQIAIKSAFLAAGICFILAIFIYFFSSLIIIRPLKKIVSAVNSFNDGNLNYEIKIKSKDELGDLADSVNKTFGSLKKSKLTLESYAKNLEARIKMRTKELETRNAKQLEANEKLEHMNKLMVGRELKMIELKKQVEKLKKKNNT